MVVLVAPEDRKMTEAEIMKEIETLLQIARFVNSDYVTSPFEKKVLIAIQDLINRKNAECKDCGIRTSESIEKLQKQIAEKTADNERLEKAMQVQEIMLDNQDYAIKKARAEAIKEVLQKVEKLKYPNPMTMIGTIIYGEDFDQIAKEMGVM